MSSTSWYRSTIWKIKGFKEYTKCGYKAAAAKFNPSDLDVDCSDRHIIITGGNKGLGLATAFQLARKGSILHLVCRNMEDAETARSSLITETGNDKIHLHHLDMSRPRDVMKFCEDFKKTHPRLDVLINNAGVMVHNRQLDVDGLEYNFAVNTLSVHLLVTGLIDILDKTPNSRVVTVSSGGMLNVKLDPVDLSFEKMKPYDGTMAYSQNKRQQVVLTSQYAVQYPSVHFSSMHPGWADTLAVRTSLPAFYEAMKNHLRTADEGADTIVWLAIADKALTFQSGQFFQDRVPVSAHLPMAWTKSSLADEQLLVKNLDEIKQRLQQTDQEGTGTKCSDSVELTSVGDDSESKLDSGVDVENHEDNKTPSNSSSQADNEHSL